MCSDLPGAARDPRLWWPLTSLSRSALSDVARRFGRWVSVNQPHIGEIRKIPSRCEPFGEARGERVGEARVLPWSSAWIHGKELTPNAIDQTCGHHAARTRRTSRCRALAPVGASPSRSSQLSTALKTIRRASRGRLRTRHSAGSCDSQHRTAVTTSSPRSRSSTNLAVRSGSSPGTSGTPLNGEAEGIVAGAMWEQIRAYDWRAPHAAPSRRRTSPRHAQVGALGAASRRLPLAIPQSDPTQPAVVVLRGCHGAEGHGRRTASPDLGAADQLEILLKLVACDKACSMRTTSRCWKPWSRRTGEQPHDPKVDARRVLGGSGRAGGVASAACVPSP